MTYRRKEIIGPHTLYLGDCREVLADLLAVNHAVIPAAWIIEEITA